MPRYFRAKNIYHQGQFCTEHVLTVDDNGYVIGVLPFRDLSDGAAAVVTDFGERVIAPGWVDLQLNGCGGGLFNRDLNLICLEKMLRSSLRHGATSVQPTLITCSDEDMLTALEVMRQAKALKQSAQKEERQLWQTAMGMHLEGPYISVGRRGAHPRRLIRPLDDTMLEKLEQAGREGILSYITVGAEAVRAEQVARLAAGGLTVSLGHSEAPIEDSRALLRAGARCFTHLYNGMGGIDSRSPKTLSLALGDKQAYSGIIADGHHVAPENIRIAQKLLGERLFLITDATATADGGEDTVFFGEQTCTIQDGTIRNEEGALAGSALTMKRGVEILADLLGWEAALKMASGTPVQALNPMRRSNRDIGTFAPGSKANFVVFDIQCKKALHDTEQISSLETWVLGKPWQE